MPQETIPIRWLKEKDSQGNKTKFFPRTHIDAVKDDDGTPLSTLLENIAKSGNRVIDGGNARTISMNLAARRIDCGRAIDKV